MSEQLSYLVLDVPVVHAGYIRLFERRAYEVSGVYLLGQEFVREATFLTAEVRALDPIVAKRLVDSLGFFREVRILGRDSLPYLRRQRVILVSNQLTRRFAEEHLVGCDIIHETAFLRHDEASVFSQAPPEKIRISTDEFDRQMMELAESAKEESSDWWRQVGAVAVIDGEPSVFSFNRHLPSEHTPYAVGDPRDFIPAGQRSDISSVLHGEQGIIAEAARRKDIGLEGADLYVTVFPCPVCAKMVAYSGIKRVFFASGHASLDGETVMRAKGVELIWVRKETA